MQPPYILDNCSFLNLYASNQLVEISRALQRTFVIADAVHGEALYIFRGGDDEDASDTFPIDSTPLIGQGVLAVVTLTPAEELTFIDFAQNVDDGEAATLALAIHRNYVPVTDDGKAARLLQARAPHVAHLSTLGLLKLWMDVAGLPAADGRVVLKAVCQRGHFEFPRRDPLKSWAASLLGAPVKLPRRRTQ